MKYAFISLLLLLLLGGCAPEISNKEIIKFTTPDIVAYDKQTQAATAVEMEKHCSITILMCELIADYGSLRDQIRVTKGEKVDIHR